MKLYKGPPKSEKFLWQKFLDLKDQKFNESPLSDIDTRGLCIMTGTKEISEDIRRSVVKIHRDEQRVAKESVMTLDLTVMQIA